MTYHFDGEVIEITLDRDTTFAERLALYHQIRADPRVPDGTLILLDARLHTEGLTQALIRERIVLIKEALGPKMGPVFAILVSEDRKIDGMLFRVVAAEYQVRVGIFVDRAMAMQWVRAYLPPIAS
jgi:hypothetical protein